MRREDQYGAMFPAFTPATATVKHDATLEDTLALIPKVVSSTLGQTRDLAPALAGRDLRETCRNIWGFCKQNFSYAKDKPGHEQVRSPRRSWLDRKSGIDCDCYSTLASSILTNLRIPHMLRVTKYDDPMHPGLPANMVPFSHIYVAVPDGSGTVKIDPVTDRFDFEVPYLDKLDIKMTLEYLNGPPGSIDAIDLGHAGGLDGLGLLKRKPKPAAQAPRPPAQPQDTRKGKGAHAINRFNPAAVLLRTGILLGMKLNMFNIGGNLRHVYLTDAQAKARNLNMARLAHLRKVHAKLEHAVFLGGGKPENLKKAILEGKGNHDKAVPLDGTGMPSFTPLGYGSDMQVADILGPVIYQGEVAPHLGGFGLGSLGEPVTASAAIAAATAILTSVAAVIKSVGDVKAGGAPGAAAAEQAAALEVQPNEPAGASDLPVPQDEGGGSGGEEPMPPEGAGQRVSADGDEGGEPKRGVWQWAKDNPAVAFGVVPVAAAALGYVIWKAVRKPPAKSARQAAGGLAGAGREPMRVML